jgi:hypothetical protein
MNKNMRFISVVISGILSLFFVHLTNLKEYDLTGDDNSDPIIRGVHTLSIHVEDTLLFDSVYRFLNKKLHLPVYYSPLKIGQRKYVGLYAGNMVLEPCGPYENIDYADDYFKSIFYGLNFEVFHSLANCPGILDDRGINHQINKGSIYIRDSILCRENIFVGLYEIDDRDKRDSLQSVLEYSVEAGPGIEYIKEIHIGYKEQVNLRKWQEFLYPLEISEDGLCKLNELLQLHFTRGKTNEVKGITFKIRSRNEALEYLEKHDLYDLIVRDRIILSQDNTFGLSISFSDKK